MKDENCPQQAPDIVHRAMGICNVDVKALQILLPQKRVHAADQHHQCEKEQRPHIKKTMHCRIVGRGLGAYTREGKQQNAQMQTNERPDMLIPAAHATTPRFP